MGKHNGKRCPCCKGIYLSLTSHLLRSKKCGRPLKVLLSSQKHHVQKPILLSKKCLILNDFDTKIYPTDEAQIRKSVDEQPTYCQPVNDDYSPIILDTDFSNPIGVCDDEYNDNLLLQKNLYRRNQTAITDPNLVFCSQLLKLINDTSAPLYLYDKIMNWAVKSASRGYKFVKGYPSRETLLKDMAFLVCLDKNLPLKEVCSLSDGTETTVNYFDFEQQCFSLLNDSNLMIDDNLTFPHNDPCDYERNEDNFLSCIEDGSVFQDSARSVCKYKNDFCLGIKLFIDATHTDVHSNWLLDPVAFTFTFFNNNVTTSDNAWRTLGFITDTNQKTTAENQQIPTDKKLQDYHSQLSIILRSIKKSQNKGGFMWNLEYKDVIHEVRMIPVVILIIGDAQGTHKFCGMYGKFFDTGRVNHSCDCRWIDSDNPNIQCNYMKRSYVKHLVSENKVDDLQSISQHNISNAFDNVTLGKHTAGIHALMPSEILHQLFLGVMQYVLNSFFNEFSALPKSRMDAFGRLLFHYGRHNSDRSIPSFNSRNGFTNLTKLRGSDRIGTCLLCFLVLSMEYGQNNLLNGCHRFPEKKRLHDYRNLFQDLLIYSEWLCMDEYITNKLNCSHIKIITIMKTIKKLVTRTSSVGWKVAKFHEMLHSCRDIRLFGPPKGYDGRPGESSHKQTKLKAKKTQRRSGLFESQTCDRIFEGMVMNTYHRSLMTLTPHLDFISTNDYYTTRINSDKSHYYIFKDEDGEISSSILNEISEKKRIKGYVRQFHKHIATFVFNYLNFDNKTRIPCRTMVRIENENDDELTLLRSNPNHFNEEWYDWAWFNWEDLGKQCVVPARIYCFVDLRNIVVSDELLELKNLKRTVYACIRSLNNTPTKLFTNSKLLHVCKWENFAGDYRFVELDTVSHACYVLPNINLLDDDNFDEWIILQNRYKWGEYFF